MHCSDEELLAYLDGEVNVLRKYVVRRHLDACWQCRTRLGETERQIQQLTQQVDEWAFPAPGWTVEGKLRLNSGIRKLERTLRSDRTAVVRSTDRGRWLLAGCAALVAVSVLIWPRYAGDRAVATEAIERASAVESELFHEPVKQTFAVQIAEVRPVKRVRNTRLEVWSDQKAGRFASKWVGSDGDIKHAVWVPGQGAADAVYSPTVSHLPVQRKLRATQSLPLDSLTQYGLDPAQVETAFLSWLEASAGKPVSFTSDLAVWSHEDGTILNAESVQSEGGGARAVRIIARRDLKTITAILRVDFDAKTYRPRLQTIRFETPERAVEFRLAATEIRRVVSTDVKNPFLSPAPNAVSERALPTARSHGSDLIVPSDLALPARSAFSGADSELLEAHFVLHQARACVGDPVKIEERPDGVRISNRADTGSQVFTSLARLDVVLSAFAELRDSVLPVTDVPEGVGSGLGSGAALRHASELARLARRFPAEKIVTLRPEHWRLLDIMLRDHVNVIGAELKRAAVQHNPELWSKAPHRNWRDSSSILFDALQNAEELLRYEPMAKVAPLLLEIQAELAGIVADFSSEYLRSQLEGSKRAHAEKAGTGN